MKKSQLKFKVSRQINKIVNHKIQVKSVITSLINNLSTRKILNQLFESVSTIRVTSFLLLFALLMPVFLIGNTQKSSAQITNPASSVSATGSSAQPFVINPISPTTGVSGSLPFAAIVGGSQAAYDFFVMPELPAGLESAKVVSPAMQTLAFAGSTASNSFSSFLAFFGLASKSSSASSSAPLVAPAGTVDFDFDGDGKADLARWQPSTAQWKIKNSGNSSLSNFAHGAASSVIAPGDFDFDGKTDAVTFNAGNWSIRQSSNGQPQTISLGQAGDRPVVGDYDGDGADDAAVFRASNSTWYVRQSGSQQTITAAFGAVGDIPVAGNYDGDSKADIAVFRPSTGDWHILGSTAGYFSFHWGVAADIPVPADYDGDGKTDPAVYRGATGDWYAYKSSTNDGSYLSQMWGNYGDQPAPADYDGDSKADFAFWRPTTGVWHIFKSSDSSTQHHTVGQAGDVAVSSAYLKQIGGVIQSYDLNKARLSPKNATGGTNLYSRNFGWSSGLVGLSGRAGMDMGFSISYNSLIWTKHTDASNNSTMYFDVDQSNITPGFRFGFPVIEPVYWNGTVQRFNYLMVTPSGSRVEFRQTSGDTYETADSSYAQLKTIGAAHPNDPVEDITISVRDTNGNLMTYEWKAGAFRCSQIKDKNGNFITVNHDAQGLLRTVTDTLGRVVTVNYDSQLYPTSVTQIWKGSNGAGANVTHTWATFSYTTKTINTNFDASINVVGPTNGTVLKVLKKITYADGSATDFDFNNAGYNSYGQVRTVADLAADGHLLNYVSLAFTAPDANPKDVLRLSETRNWTENFNQNQQGVAQETIVTNTLDTGSTYNVDGQNYQATKIEVSMTNHPHGAVSKTFVGESGWQEALPMATEDWANGTGGLERKRWMRTIWTQDDTNLTEILNPRVTETKVGDPSNTKRMTTSYYMNGPNTNVSYFGLVYETNVYAEDQTTVLKKTQIAYNHDVQYLYRRMFGLVSQVVSWGRNSGNQQLEFASKMRYFYDVENFAVEPNQNIESVTQHDTQNFGANFIVGRGNLIRVARYAADDENSSMWVSHKFYDIAGSPVAVYDGLFRRTGIEYTDGFNDGQSRNTFAYPTKVTDPAGNFSQVKYRFDTGANVWAKSPTPYGNIKGKETVREYDAVGRLLMDKIINTGAYTRYAYAPNGTQFTSFTTVIDSNNNGGDSLDEVFTETRTDGAGRTRSTHTLHPGTYYGMKGTKTEYDILGRVKRTTVPTEINNSFQPTGDDARGLATNGDPIWLWNKVEYDWKGRVTKETGTDNTERNYAYQGCGCAGGEEVLMTGEEIEPGKSRRQKIYSDILGRQWKTELLNYDGTVYTAAVHTFNGRDQIVKTRRTDGAAASTVFQETTNVYDGYGRIIQKHIPQQDPGTYTAYTYYADDRQHTVTDARGAVTTYAYNERGLISQINSNLAGSNPPPNGPSQLSSGTSLGAEDYLISPNGKYKLVYQNDGNFVLYQTSDNSVRWALNQGHSPGHVTMQNDGNLVIYNSGGQLIFQTDTANGQPGSRLVVQDDGNIVIYRADHSISWQSNSFTKLPEPSANSSAAFGYDAAGNRLWMTDDLGRTDYEYDQLSRLKSETRSFSDTNTSGSPLVMAHAPLPNNSFKLQYTYGLAGQLTSITDPFGELINYSYDQIGRLSGVTGSSFGGVTTYAAGAEYRAWDALKKVNYGSGFQMNAGYNNQLKASSYTLSKAGNNPLMNKSYDYYADGALRLTQDLVDSKFNRLQTYDQAGRLKEAKSGNEALGQPVPTHEQAVNLPYRQSYNFNVFDNLEQRNNLHWGTEYWEGQSNNLNYAYLNNRVTNQNWNYDADGRLLGEAAYNAAGKIMWTGPSGVNFTAHRYNGDGREVKRHSAYYTRDADMNWVWMQPRKYYIRSSVLGGEVVSEVWANGRKGKTFIKAAGVNIAYQSAYGSETSNLQEAVFYDYSDASRMSQRSSDKDGFAVATGDNGEGSKVETDPMGNNMGTYTRYHENVEPYQPDPDYPMLFPLTMEQPMYIDGMQARVSLDGFPINWALASSLLESGAAIPASIAPYQNSPGFRFASYGVGIFISEHWVPGNDENDPLPPANKVTKGHWETNVFTWNLSQSDDEIVNRRKGKRGLGPRGDLEDFLSKNPNCLDYMKNILGDKFDSFMESLFDMKIIDTSINPQFGGRTLTELQIPTINNDGTFGIASGTLNDLFSDPGILAVASPNTNTAYLSESFYTDSRSNLQQFNSQRGFIILHEQLHIFFRANHVGILSALQLPAQQPTVLKAYEGGLNINPRTGRLDPPKLIFETVIDEERSSSIYLNKWLNNNCK